MKEEQEKEYIIFKINTKNFFKVYKSSYNGKDYYKVMVTQKNYDETETKCYKTITFKKGLPIPENGSLIRIKRGIENLYVKGNDIYNPMSTIIVLDYELKENEEQQKQNAYNEFSDNLANREAEEIKIDDSELPF